MQKRTGMCGNLVVLFCLMGMLFSVNAFAQDNAGNSDETQNAVVFHDTKYEFNLGIGEGVSVPDLDIPLISVSGGLFYNAYRVWRTGVDFNLMLSTNWAHDNYINQAVTLLFLNEIIAYRGRTFEFAPRLGIGYRFENRVRDDEYSSVAEFHMFSANFGLGFDWRVSQLISLGLNIDYLMSTVLNKPTSYSGYPEFECGDLEHLVSLKFNIGFHL